MNIHTACRVTVDLAALQENFRLLSAYASDITAPVCGKQAKKGRPICVVKANAYGHGALPCARALAAAGADFFAVATAAEGVALRAALPQADILILSPIAPEDAPCLVAERLIASVGSEEDMRRAAAAVRRAIALGRLPQGSELTCHAKLDTGMHRLGFAATQENEGRYTAYALRTLAHLPGIQLTGVYSHPAAADDPRDLLNTQQQSAFFRVKELLSPSLFYHYCNSAATLLHGSMGLDGYRLGIALYGIPPAGTFPVALCGRIRAVARVETKLTRIFLLRAGQRLGYGGDYIAVRDTRVGTAAIGYADGLPRAATGACLLVRGQARPIIGRICMDQCMLDLGDTPAEVGDAVCVTEESGRQLCHLSAQAGTIPYELLCHLPQRATWIYT